MSELVCKAQIFATQVHAGQVRGNRAKSPFIFHPQEVARLVRGSGGSDEEIVAAFLHDTVEDTSTTMSDIIQYFGEEIGDMVDGLTDPVEFNDLQTSVRKAKQALRVRSKSDSVKRIKLADQISNVRSIAADAPTWSRQKCIDYIEGARSIAMECRGVSEYLDIQFKKAYKVAAEVHS